MQMSFDNPGARRAAQAAMGPGADAGAAYRQARMMAAVEAAAMLSRIAGRELAPNPESDQC